MVPVKKKTKIAILIASLAVFALVLAAALLLSRGAGSDRVQSGEHPLRISEYMSANTAYPNADGRICDWIEIHNTSDKPFNVSGYRLSDDVTQAKYAFPVGTVIPADGYIVVYCDPETSGGLYAPFSLRRLGGETLLLMNSANTVLDEIETLRCRKNTSIVRETDGSFTVSAAPTPGYANTDEGYTAYLAASGQGMGALRLSEIMAAETLFTAPNGALCDWVEIENTGSETADLSGMHLTDKAGEARYTFPEGTLLAPGAFTVVWCSGDGTEGADYAAIRLAKAGESVILTDTDGNALDRIQTPFLADDTAYAAFRASGASRTGRRRALRTPKRATPPLPPRAASGTLRCRSPRSASAAKPVCGTPTAIRRTGSSFITPERRAYRSTAGISPTIRRSRHAGAFRTLRSRRASIASFSPPAKTGRRASRTRTLPSPRGRSLV